MSLEERVWTKSQEKTKTEECGQKGESCAAVGASWKRLQTGPCQSSNPSHKKEDGGGPGKGGYLRASVTNGGAHRICHAEHKLQTRGQPVIGRNEVAKGKKWVA